jgi:hypothetical protein
MVHANDANNDDNADNDANDTDGFLNHLDVLIPLLALTHKRNDRQRDKVILVGMGNLRFLQVKRG